jgi:hypothetical protein
VSHVRGPRAAVVEGLPVAPGPDLHAYTSRGLRSERAWGVLPVRTCVCVDVRSRSGSRGCGHGWAGSRLGDGWAGDGRVGSRLGGGRLGGIAAWGTAGRVTWLGSGWPCALDLPPRLAGWIAVKAAERLAADKVDAVVADVRRVQVGGGADPPTLDHGRCLQRCINGLSGCRWAASGTIEAAVSRG